MAAARALLALLVVGGALGWVTVGAAPATSSPGDDVWFRQYHQGHIRDAVAVEDGFILVGDVQQPLELGHRDIPWVGKVNRTGSLQWQRRFNVSTDGTFHAVTRLESGDMIAAGMRDGRTPDDHATMWLVKFDTDGEVVWETRLAGGPRHGEGKLLDVVGTGDGGAVAVGQDTKSRFQGIVVRVRPSGKIQWVRLLGGEDITAVTRDWSGRGFVLAGTGEKRPPGTNGARLIWLSADGSERWARFYGTELPGLSTLYLTTDGIVAAGGRTVMEVTFLGTVTDVHRFEGLPGTITAMHRLPDGGRVLGLVTEYRYGGLVRYDSTWDRERQLTSADGHPIGSVAAITAASDGRVLVVGTRARYDSYTTGFAYLSDQEPPTPRLVAVPNEAEVGITEVVLDAGGSVDNTAIDRYRWDLDEDGQYEDRRHGPNVTPIFHRRGVVNVTVTVVDVDGNRANATVPVTLIDTTPPTVELSAPRPHLVATAAPARLNASASADNHRIVEYRWDFGADGTIDEVTTSPGTRHHFASNGSHRFAVTAVDEVGLNTTRTFAVSTVSNDGPPNVTVETSLAVVGERTYFSANASDQVGTPRVRWRFPNGSVVHGPTAIYTFNRTGEQSVTLIVSDEYGARDRVAVTVEVLEHYPPDVSIGPAILAVVVFYGLGILVAVGLVVAVGYEVWRWRTG